MRLVKRLSIIFVVFMVLSQISVADRAVEDFFTCLMISSIWLLLCAAIGFRVNLVVEGTKKILEKAKK
jgi:hypothetical protein